jgi:hypothetical protein
MFREVGTSKGGMQKKTRRVRHIVVLAVVGALGCGTITTAPLRVTESGPGDAGGDVGELAARDAGDVAGQVDVGDDAAGNPPPCDPSASATVGNRILYCSTTSTLAGRRCAVCCTSDGICGPLNRIQSTCVLSPDVVCVSGDPTCAFAGCSP